MSVGNRGELFFWYPEPGDTRDKWRSSWDQVMNKPANDLSNMLVRRDDKTDDESTFQHTWAHKDLATLSLSEVDDEFTQVDSRQRTQSKRDYLGFRVRPLLSSIWISSHVSNSGDSVGVSAAQCNARYDALVASHPNNILTLNHETYESTATTVLPHAIQVLKRAGYNLVTVAECLGLPLYLSVGKVGTKDSIVFPEITITSFTETGQAESSIKVPLQRSYTGRIPVIPSSLADTPCATLGIPGLLDLFNTTLGTSRTLDTTSLSSVLEKNNYDFGTVYGRLRAVWSTAKHGTVRGELRRREANDRKM
ncbi:hypothetical protein ARMGADRAFT_1080892 [Armillaria gallica]|uniref:Chitin deacetylase n=1 Tax=Armillaria gallica TaxID=47427 RepID=A0A2H3DA28_ARMGA|nr:hypothetical protein ARMGADRAFT_1080892 [Armillaria gallica]